MSKCWVRSTLHRKRLYWTLFWPKNWAAASDGRSGIVTVSAARASSTWSACRRPARRGFRSMMLLLMAWPSCSAGHRGIPRLPKRHRHRVPRNRSLGRFGPAPAASSVALTDLTQQSAHRHCTRRGRKVRPRSLVAADEQRGPSPLRDEPGEEPRLLRRALRHVERHHRPVGAARGVGQKARGFPFERFPEERLETAIETLPLFFETRDRAREIR